jgi:DNA-directed RNA polymerase I subunit RPA2
MGRHTKKNIGGKRTDLLETSVKGGPNVGQQLEYMLATGNVISQSGLALPQMTGLCVVAEKINFHRFLSHFRSLHRGAYFAQMRTTAVRKLLPESYGFICPVHTPDGAPCGLLNHITALCQVTNASPPVGHIPHLLASYGMIPLGGTVSEQMQGERLIPVMLNGRLIGRLDCDSAQQMADQLRMLKVEGKERVPKELEIALIPKTESGLFPGLYLFATPARLIRPVHNLRASGAVEMIGTLEQVYLDIAVCPEEIHEEVTTHLELKRDSLLSIVAKLTPFSDFNQSPRNMYQCQMGKQTMGVPAHIIKHRADTKLYCIQTPQTPIVRPTAYDDYQMDEYPTGTNAIVAVISYTGYDMEDAMVVNKSSMERGFAYGSIYKSEIIDLSQKVAGNLKHGNVKYVTYRFGIGDKQVPNLEPDGLPAVGSMLNQGDPLYCYVDQVSRVATIERYKSHETAYVDDVKLLGNDYGTGELQSVLIRLRVPRAPTIGDKFSSRHGQKGICSMLWPEEDMPFSESGIVPDILFNPHGFPSRMTIGMMVESMAGKSGALHGLCHDATPFTFSEENSAIDYFGRCLLAAGYNYFGNERMYSGITGREFETDIFIGNIYYQRLRHMVADKFQVRTTGPVDQLTHQPVQGKRRGGGIRFGEMERDALLAHGTSFLLQDRLLNCSDRSLTRVCTSCGSILSPVFDQAPSGAAATAAMSRRRWRCKVCRTHEHIETVAIPYVCKYLIAELAAMNIKVMLEVK